VQVAVPGQVMPMRSRGPRGVVPVVFARRRHAVGRAWSGGAGL